MLQVLTIPAHFNSQQKDATLAAAQLAGLPRALLLQEPVAAALAHGIGGGTDGETVLVFDLGGGTFDVRWGWLEVGAGWWVLTSTARLMFGHG